jgi:hypothetical protein
MKITTLDPPEDAALMPAAIQSIPVAIHIISRTRKVLFLIRVINVNYAAWMADFTPGEV